MTSTDLMLPPGKAALATDPLSATLNAFEVRLFATYQPPRSACVNDGKEAK